MLQIFSMKTNTTPRKFITIVNYIVPREYIHIYVNIHNTYIHINLYI